MKRLTLMMVALLTAAVTFAQDAEPKEVTLTWEAAQMGWQNAEDVTAFNLAPDLTATIAQNGGNSAKYYNTGESLRLYASNSITLKGSDITKIVLTLVGEEKHMRLEGEGYADGIWTGKADEVTLTVPSTSGSQARIQRMVVTYSSIYEPGSVVVPTEVVTLPADAQPLTYTLEAKGYEPDEENEGEALPYNVLKTTQVAFFGNDVYVQGLSYFFPEAWVKGTISGSKVVFRSPQLYGSDDDGSIYFAGYDDETEELADAVTFDYDADTKTLVCNEYILENGYADEVGFYDYFYYVKLYPGDPAEVVELPEGVVAKEYHYSGYDTYYEEDVEMPVMVAIDGSDVYMQGLSVDLPEAWVKGELSDGVVTFEEGQLMGTCDYFFYAFDLYFGGATFTYDAEKGTFACESYTTLAEDYEWETYESVLLTPISDVAATPKAPSIKGLDYDDDYGYSINLYVPLESSDGNYLLSEKLSYQLYYDVNGQAVPYVLKATDYENLDADITMVPYNLDDDWDIYRGGATLYIYGDVESWKRIGVKSIYTGGGETRESAISWVDMSTLGIASTTAAGETVKTVCYDLQGRRAAATQKGLVIVQQHAADGSVKVAKMVNR